VVLFSAQSPLPITTLVSWSVWRATLGQLIEMYVCFSSYIYFHSYELAMSKPAPPYVCPVSNLGLPLVGEKKHLKTVRYKAISGRPTFECFLWRVDVHAYNNHQIKQHRFNTVSTRSAVELTREQGAVLCMANCDLLKIKLS